MNLGAVYRDIGQHANAIEALEKAVALQPDHANAHLLLGLAYRDSNRMDEARTNLEKVLKLNPNDPRAAWIKQLLENTRSSIPAPPDS